MASLNAGKYIEKLAVLTVMKRGIPPQKLAGASLIPFETLVRWWGAIPKKPYKPEKEFTRQHWENAVEREIQKIEKRNGKSEHRRLLVRHQLERRKMLHEYLKAGLKPPRGSDFDVSKLSDL